MVRKPPWAPVQIAPFAVTANISADEFATVRIFVVAVVDTPLTNKEVPVALVLVE